MSGSIGKLVVSRENLVDVFAGYIYWNNKFGTNADYVVGAREQTWYAGVAWHLLQATGTRARSATKMGRPHPPDTASRRLRTG